MENEFKGWEFLYEELSEKIINQLTDIKWIDLWHNQVGFLVDEHPFPTPAIFLNFRILNTEELSEKSQEITIQIDLYYYYETFLDTHIGAINKSDALDYLKTTTEIHKLFHATSGDNYNEMKRIGFAPVDTGAAGNLYRISFTAELIDATAAIEYETVTPGNLEQTRGQRPMQNNDGKFILP